MKIIIYLIFGLLLSLLTGCASNPYANYYCSNHKPGTFAAPIGEPRLIQVTDAQFQSAVADLKARGLVCVGNSCFTSNHGFPAESLLFDQARRVQADKVLLVSKVIGVQTERTVATYEPAPTYTFTSDRDNSATITATPYTQFGYAVVPCHIEISEIGASYWRRPIP